MSIKEIYNQLLEKEYKFSLINEINVLKEQCIIENNTERVDKVLYSQKGDGELIVGDDLSPLIELFIFKGVKM